jgi:hypothetical protein
MLFTLRVFFTGLFLWLIASAAGKAGASDLGDAGRFALAIGVGIVSAITWAPFFGEVLAGPMTGVMLDGSPSIETGWMLRAARRFEARKWRRAAVLLAFCEGVRHPNLPGAFIVGMNNAAPGGWLQKAFAREVWRNNHVGNCIRAHAILEEEHGVTPGIHPSPEVTLALQSRVRSPRPAPAILPVPTAERPVLKRNPGIRLFKTGPRRNPTKAEEG